jgi:cobalamin biosynthesis protein CbiG
MLNERIVIALTRRGAALAERIAQAIPVDIKVPQRFLENPDEPKGFAESVATVIAAAFPQYRALILIMATGVAVRSIAPLLHGRQEDPAVVVLDEESRFAISLLSGHLGGANELAIELAQRLGGTAVVTTASDLQNLPALDLIAQCQNMRIENPEFLPRVAAALVNGDPVVLWDRWG